MAERAGSWWRLGGLFLGFAALMGLAWSMGWTDGWTPQTVGAWIESAGAWGIAGYLVLFAIGNMMQVPGVVFMTAAVLVWGPLWGTLLAFLGALGAVMLSFAIVRQVGGSPLGGLEKPWVQRTLARLEERPLRVIVMLRTFMIASPPLNMALAMTGLRARTYLTGSALGLVVPVAFVCLGVEAIEAFMCPPGVG